MNNYVFVKADLLLHEGSFKTLRDFLSTVSIADVTNFCSLELCNDEIILQKCELVASSIVETLIGQKLQNGYMLICMKDLCHLVLNN